MNPVLKFSTYVLAHAPNLLLHYGASQRLEEKGSEILEALPAHLRDYETALAYYPHQVYIGNAEPEELSKVERPWYKHPHPNSRRFGRFGEMMPEDELLGLIKIVDTFDLVWLEKRFSEGVREKLKGHPVLSKCGVSLESLDSGRSLAEIDEALGPMALPLSLGGQVVGCVKAASDRDENQTAHLMLELLVNKATGVLALAHLLDKVDIKPDEVDFAVECSEEIAGDVYNRGGGGIGKSILEIVGCKNATAYDLKSFCAAPVFALFQIWALVTSGLYDNVVAVAGGSLAKLGMNARDHVRKGMPALEDVVGGFAALISEDDGVNPMIVPMGKQDVAVSYHVKDMLGSLIFEPLKRMNLRVTDVDVFAPELQIPEVLGRDIPNINYRLIAETSARIGEIGEDEKEEFVRQRGVPGFAPQQGHIPSGVPILGHARDRILSGKMNRAVILGKGSLFLSRLTKLHDGVSLMIEKNQKQAGNEPRTTT
jgi:betaine reductase